MIWRFGEFELDDERFALRQGDREVELRRRVFDVLRYLVAHRNRLVSKEELLENVWPDEVIQEAVVAQNIAILRRVLAREPDVRFYLATDDPETERHFRRTFGDRIDVLAKSVHGTAARGSAQGMQDAVVDLYRLARTRAILGNDHSTFSLVASLLGPDRLLLANAKNAGTERRGPWERLLA